jgi:hypothetical protein
MALRKLSPQTQTAIVGQCLLDGKRQRISSLACSV